MPGEITALISGLCYALSYIYLNRAQIKGDTCDTGLMPVLYLSSATLIIAYVARTPWVHARPTMDKEWWTSVVYCVLAGVSWNFLGRLTLYSSIARIGATRGVVIKSVAPIVTLVIAVLFLKESITVTDALGFVLMLSSISLLVVEKRLARTSPGWLSTVNQGILLGLAAAILQGIGHVLRKIGVEFASPALGAALDMTAAAVAYTLYLLLTRQLIPHIRFYIRRPSADLLAAGALSAVGSLTFFVATANASISTVAMIIGMQPVFMPILSSLLFRGFERFTWLSYLSALLVAVGVAVIMVNGA